MIMKDVFSIINNTKEENKLGQIIKGRSLATIPFGGRYRLIDFYLSNMVNSGIQNVGILVRKNYRSLLGHVRSPKEWDLDRKNDGIFILPPDNEDQHWGNLRGDLEVLNANMDYIVRSKQKYVLITSSNIICNIDYTDAVKYHKANENDITVIYNTLNSSIKDVLAYTQIKIDDKNKVTDMEMNSNKINGGKVSLESYVMEKSLLMDIIYACISRGEYDLVKDGIIRNLNKYKVHGYEFKGEVFNINSVQSYYNYSMKLLDNKVWNELFFNPNPIYTKMKDLAPVKYGECSNVKNSLIANGCVIDGEVKNSIIFRNVRIEKGVKIKDSIIMQNTIIDKNSILENVIIDKDCFISKGNKFKGSQSYPTVIEKNTTI